MKNLKIKIMQNRNVIKIFAILFAIVCLYQLSFTWIAGGVEDDAVAYASNYEAEEQEAKQKFYLDSINSEIVFDIGLTEYTFAECQQRELNLGLDLKGGMNVTLEVMVIDVVKALSNNSKDEAFNAALANAINAQRNSQDDFVTLFGIEYEKVAPALNSGLSAIFSTPDLRDKIQFSSTNKEVIEVLAIEVEDAISRSFNILRSRIDRFGVTQPNIQRLETAGRILVELPGIKDPERARKLLQSTAQLEFWEAHKLDEVLEICDEFTVLRDGEVINTDLISNTNKDQLITNMAGREISQIFPKKHVTIEKEILNVKNLYKKFLLVRDLKY